MLVIVLNYLSKSRTNMINNPDWLKPKITPYLHKLSPECIEEIAVLNDYLVFIINYPHQTIRLSVLLTLRNQKVF